MSVVITPLDAAPTPYLLWDSVYSFDAGLADWQMGTPAPAELGTFNPGGLLVNDPVATAICIGLLTDARCPEGHPLEKYAGDDRRGWWGDGVDIREDLGEQPLGSLLWLLENATATDANAIWAQTFARDALQPLIKCGLATYVGATATAYPALNAIRIDVQVAGSLNGQKFNRTYAGVWSSEGANAQAFPDGAS